MELVSGMIEAHVYRETEKGIEFLLIKRSEKEIYPGLWQMVSGSVEEGEKAFEAALREVKEETGIIPLKMWVLPNINSFYSPVTDKINFSPVFLVKAASESSVVLSDEHEDYGWFSVEKTRAMLAWHGQKVSVDIIVEFLKNNDLFLRLSEICI